jgi:hypothetical protein
VSAAIAVVGSDRLAVVTSAALRSTGVEVVDVPGHQLADAPVSLRRNGFSVHGRPIAGMLLCEPVGTAAPHGFAGPDWSFVLAELGATWLAAANLDGMLAINRLDAEAWYEGGQWPVWQRRLGATPVELSPLRVGASAAGARWRPYTGGADRPAPAEAVRRALGTALTDEPIAGAALFVCGEPVGPAGPGGLTDAAALLRGSGLELVSIAHDAEGRVATVDPYPAVAEDIVAPVAARLAGAFHDHLRRR